MTQRSIILLDGLIAAIKLCCFLFAVFYAVIGRWDVATFNLVIVVWFDLHAHIRRIVRGE